MVLLDNPAQRYAEPHERIVNFTGPYGGGLINVVTDDIRKVTRVEVYRLDETVAVSVAGHRVTPVDDPGAGLFDRDTWEAVVLRALESYRETQQEHAAMMRRVAASLRAGIAVPPFVEGEAGAAAAEQRAVDHEYRDGRAEDAMHKIIERLAADD